MTGDNRPDEFEDGPAAPDEAQAGREQEARHERDTEAEIFESVRGADGGPVVPVRLKGADPFNFSCHRGISCWNQCCHGADVTLTPLDILRLSRNQNIRPAEFVARYTAPGIWETAGLPVPKLKMTGEDGKGACSFLHQENGCTVYADRPMTCRYYPLGLGAAKMKDSPEKMNFHFLVKESFCKGHDESKTQTVDAFRAEQGVAVYDDFNQGWIDILMKMASWKTLGGPQGKDVSIQGKKMFYLVSTDPDAFRAFVFKTRFLETYLIEPEAIERVKSDDETLLQLGFDWLKNVFFNEPTIALRPEVLQQAVAATRERMGGS